MRARVGALLGYLALTLLCVGAVASIPSALMSVEQNSAWAFSGLFVVGVGLAVILTARPMVSAALIGVLLLAGSISTAFAIQGMGLKELHFALWFENAHPEVFGALLVNPIQFWAFLLGTAALIAGLGISRVHQTPFRRSLPISLLVSCIAIAAIDIVGSLLGLSRMMDPMDLVVFRFVLPMAVSAITALAWLYTVAYVLRRKVGHVG